MRWFIGALRERFNSGVRYKGRILKWDTVIQEKTNELARYLTGMSSKLDFIEPTPRFDRVDNLGLRERIMSLTAEEAKKFGINKSTLYTLRQHARDERPFCLYGKISRKLKVPGS